ncbi:MAG: ATP/GTP-binding protein [Archaeoglobi archaeon]|nr:ATP/GTP-binding protein [Candidatus Mnemosynella bozhongmuii]
MTLDRIYIYFIGTAGSGKSYLTKSFGEWLDLKRLDYVTVNLDPGAEMIPYSPDVDIREWFTLEDIMQNYGVGPNGAQIVGADLISLKAEEIKEEIDGYSGEYVLIDTPGQMELFTLRKASEIIIDVLERSRSVMVFLFDPMVSRTPDGFLSVLFMCASATFRLKIPQIPVLSKSDLLSEDEVERIVEWSGNPDALYEELRGEGVSLELFHALKESRISQEIYPVSSETFFGMEDIYDGIQEIFYGGEDTEGILF